MAAAFEDLLAPDKLRRLADVGSFARGEDYARAGRVQTIDMTEDCVRAFVRGSEQYVVQLLRAGGRLRAQCTCPIGQQGAFCKHAVATALVASGGAGVPEEVPASDDHFARDEEVAAFIAAHGLAYVRQLGAEVMAPHLPQRERETLRYVLTRHPLLDFASAQSLKRYGYALAHAPRVRECLPRAARAFLQAEAENLPRATAEAKARASVKPPEATQELFGALLRLRAEHEPATPPRLSADLAGERLRFAEGLPGFLWADDRPWVPEKSWTPASMAPTVELTLTLDRAKAGCALCAGLCLHTLAATDAALLRLGAPDETALKWAGELRRPAWERALSAIEGAITSAARSQEEFLITWRLHISGGDGIDVQPFVHRLGKKGYSAGTRVSARTLLERYAEVLSAADVRVARAAEHTITWATRDTLEALVGHPRVFLSENPQAQVKVDKARIGLLADHRGDSVALCAALDGAPLPSSFLARVGRRQGGTPLYLYEEAARRLTLLEIPPEVTQTLEAVARFGNDFPPESHAALVEKLSSLSARVPVAMPRSVLGEAVPAQIAPVLRLELRPEGTVRVELRIRPLPEAAAFCPGEGAKDVHVRRDGKAVHARRDFAAEHTAAQAWAERLALPPSEDGQPFTSSLPSVGQALAVLQKVAQWEGERPELEWVGEAVRIAARAQPGALKVVLEKKRDWFGATGGLAVEGERISLAVLLDAARRKERFVRVERNTYVEVSEALQRHLERLADHAWTAAHGVEIGPSAADTLNAMAEAGVVVDADRTWRTLTERIFAAKELTPRVPRGLTATLRDYQVDGYRWLTRLASWGAGAVLADDMGLGKTVQALAVLLDRARLGPQLVVAPTSVGFNWVDEARRFAPGLRFHLFADSPDRAQTLQTLRPKDVLVLSYGLLARDVTRLSKVKFATIVFDEAQAFKNAHTHRARAARELNGDFKFALSGTPLENHLGELWSIFRTVFPGLLGSWDSFRDRYATPIEKKIDPSAAPALSRVIQPFLLRRTKDQVAKELPPRTDLRVPVVLSPEEWQLYEDARLAALSELETPKSKLREQQRRVQVLAALTRLRLLASHPRLYDKSSKLASSKLERVMELLEELLDEGHRALVFSQFTSHLALVREVLDERGIRYLYLDGGTPRKERAHLVRAFQEGDAPVFLVSLKAGGFGLNLTGADNVIHLDPWWNPAVEDQASDRAHRIGQKRPVTVYRLVAKGTIEEQILSLHEDKRQLVAGVLDGKDQAARLSTTELLALLARPALRGDDVEPPSDTKH